MSNKSNAKEISAEELLLNVMRNIEAVRLQKSAHEMVLDTKGAELAYILASAKRMGILAKDVAVNAGKNPAFLSHTQNKNHSRNTIENLNLFINSALELMAQK